MMDKKHKPCPFCGSENQSPHYDIRQGFKWGSIQCECGASGPEVKTEYKKTWWHKFAWVEWDTREGEE
jgi:hypothetical protein